MEAVEIGGASVTINNKTKHITIYGKNQSETAFLNDWICRSIHGKLYVLDNQTFRDENEFTHVRGVAEYRSGRTEEFEAKLRADGTPPKAFSKKVSHLRCFPTVTNVKTERYSE